MFKVKDDRGNIDTVYSVRKQDWEIQFLVYEPGAYDKWIWVDAKDYSPYKE